MLCKENFIEYPREFDRTYRKEAPSPLFRKRFLVKPELKKAVLKICGLGYAHCYLNAQTVTKDLFIAPVSNYDKTLWYTAYDVTGQLPAGSNLLAVILGNGFYNEPFRSAWDYDQAPWRDNLRFTLSLELTYDFGTEYVLSDESWKCSDSVSQVRMNYLRSGERHDLRYPNDWNCPEFDDSGWVNARICPRLPRGTLRQCTCQGIRERWEYTAREIFQNAEGHWVFDFGQNMSGYVKASLSQNEGDVITVRYAEELNTDGTRKCNDMYDNRYYPETEFQTDRFVCSGKEDIWQPLFVYHGFRYAIVEGLRETPTRDTLKALFVCQDVRMLSDFACSDEVINRLFNMGRKATLSNLFYMPTDCPTREKLGWCNDARASAEQMLQNFDIAPLFRKWIYDIYDAIREDGSMPGIIPTAGWGYDWGSGPLSNSVLFELPYRVYRYLDDPSMLIESLPYFKKYLHYADTYRDAQGLVAIGLCDWAGPFEAPEAAPTPLKFTDTCLVMECYETAALAAKLAKDPAEAMLAEKAADYRRAMKKAYMDSATGRCKVDEMTAVAMVIGNRLYETLEPVKQQLKALVEKFAFHHNCGMLGIQYLYYALDKCGLSEYAYRIITVKTRPSYREWIDGGGTALWEKWNDGESKNHHMYSCLLAWFNRTLVGLNLDPEENAYKKAVIRPAFLPQLSHCQGEYETASGHFSIAWQRMAEEIRLKITVPTQTLLETGSYFIEEINTRVLMPGTYEFICKQK